MSWLGRLFGKSVREKKAPVLQTPVRLDPCPPAVYAVGDVHGCCALYAQLERKIRDDAQTLGIDPVIVLLGDMVDRGPDSSGLLEHLSTPVPGLTRYLLMGNHEQMMRDFLANPVPDHPWLLHGGWQTLESYGIYARNLPKGRDAARRLQMAVQSSIPEPHLDLLEALAPYILLPNAVLAHASLDPSQPLDAQPLEALLWGEPQIVATAEREWPVLVHGHVISEKVEITPTHIGVDTGAYQTGELSAVRLHCHPGASAADQTAKIISVLR